MKQQTNSLKAAAYALGLALLLLLALALLAVPVRADEVTHYDLWIGGLEVTSERLYYVGADADPYGTGKWSYDPETNTLTLDNYHYTGAGRIVQLVNREIQCALYYNAPKNLRIKLIGTSSLTVNAEKLPAYCLDSYSIMNVLFTSEDGTGEVSFTAGSSERERIGINCDGSITVQSGKVGCYGGAGIFSCMSVGGDVRVQGGVLTVSGEDQKAIDARNLYTDGMTVRAGADAEHATDESYTNQKYVQVYKSYGLWVGGQEVTSANLVYEGAQSDAYGTGKWSYDPSAYTLTLDAYSYSGEGYACNPSSRAALYYNGVDDLTITLVGDSRLTTVSGDTIPLYSFGMHFDGIGHSATPQLTIQSASGGSLTVEAGSAGYNSYGINVHMFDLLLAGADVETVGGHSNTSGSFGLLTTSSTLKIGSGASLTARGGQSDYEDSIGVSTEGAILVSGGKLDAKGGQAGNGKQSIGIASTWIEETGPSISVTGGVLIAEGD